MKNNVYRHIIIIDIDVDTVTNTDEFSNQITWKIDSTTALTSSKFVIYLPKQFNLILQSSNHPIQKST